MPINYDKNIVFCKKCTMSNQRPRIVFDENGVCAACNYAYKKRNVIDWGAREQELSQLCDKFRKNDGSYDVLVPCSGGKDGSYVAHMLKSKYEMNPLTVTWSPLLMTDIGRKNLDNFIMSGFDNVFGRPNGDVARRLTALAFEHMGDPFQPFIYGQINFPLRVACNEDIKLIFYGENGEVEYGGDLKYEDSPSRSVDDNNKHYFSGINVSYWEKLGISQKELLYFTAPYEKILGNGTEIHWMSYYHLWDPQENFYYSVKNTGFSPNPERSEGTYSKYASIDDKLDGFHFYLMYMKFGIGRATSDASHEIRDGKITREEGVQLIKRYDGEFPEKNFKTFLEYCDITEDKFWQIIEKWRSDHIWIKSGNKMKLRNAVYDHCEIMG